MTEQYPPTELEKAVDLLESWADDQILPMNDFCGICYNLFLHDVTTRWEGLVAVAAESWPEFSGDKYYPARHEDMGVRRALQHRPRLTPPRAPSRPPLGPNPPVGEAARRAQRTDWRLGWSHYSPS